MRKLAQTKLKDMKKLLLIAGFGLFMSSSLFAQTPVMQGSILIDGGLGWPTGNLAWNTASDGEENYKVNGGQFAYGGRVEYMLADDFGIAIDGNYVKTGYNYDRIDTISVYDPVSMTFSDSSYSDNFDYTAKKTRIMIRLNKHIVQNDLVDAYIGAGVGYKAVSRVFSTNDEIDAEQEEALLPITFRFAFGARFFFTDNIGAHIELGAWGGSPLQFGLSFKF